MEPMNLVSQGHQPMGPNGISALAPQQSAPPNMAEMSAVAGMQMGPPHQVAQMSVADPSGLSSAGLAGPLDTSSRGASNSATPHVEIKLFVGRVPRTCTEEQLKPIFEEYARVLEVAIIRDKTSGNHKGSAFIRLASITEADHAIRALNNVKILDPDVGPIQVRYAQGEAEKLGLTGDGTCPGQDQTKLFVGSLPKGITEEEVHKMFSVFGTIDEIYLLKEPDTNVCRGCAFVKFSYKEQAMNAIKSYNGQLQLPNAPRPLEVRVAETKKTQQQPAFSQMTPTLRGIQNAPPSNTNPRSSGSWKEYFTTDNTPYYHNELTNVTQWDRPPEFDQLAPAAAPRSDVTGPPGANIFVFHIPNDWTTYDLHSNFGPFGNILSAHIPTDKQTNRNKGYGFVSYDAIQSAVAAVTCMNGFMANGKRLKVSIKQHEDKYVAHLMPPGGAQCGQGVGGMGMVAGMGGAMGAGMGMGGAMGAGIVGGMTSAQNMRPVMGGGMVGQAQPSGVPQHVANMSAVGLMPQFQAPGPVGYAGYQYNMQPPTAQPRYQPY